MLIHFQLILVNRNHFDSQSIWFFESWVNVVYLNNLYNLVPSVTHMQHLTYLIATPSHASPLRFVSSSRYRSRRPPEAVYSQDEFR